MSKEMRKYIDTFKEKLLNESISKEKDQKIKDLILNGYSFGDWVNAVKLQYGEIVPLYHATTEEVAQIIDKEGFKLTYGKNYKSFANDRIIYFQLGKSDYVSSNRPVLYRVDVPLDFLANYVDIDIDNPSLSDEELSKYINLEEFENLESDFSDVIYYFIWNDCKLEGTELLVSENLIDDETLSTLKPIRLN